MILALAGNAFQFLAATCLVFVLLHAFQRSAGTGFLVLLIPPVWFIYGFSQFEHRRKGLILAGLMGGGVVGVVLKTLVYVRATA